MFEIRPILSALLRHKSSTFLIVLQIAITFAVVVNASSIIKQRIEMMNRESGMPEAHLLTLNVNAFGSNYDLESNIRADIELLRNTPGVVDAVAINQVPLTGNGDSGSISATREQYDNRESVAAGFFMGDSHMLNTLGVKLIEGRDFNEQEVIYTAERPEVKSSIITKSLADKLYPNGNALGKPIYIGGGEYVTIVGIVKKMSGSWVHSSLFEDSMMSPIVSLDRFKRILIRTESPQITAKLLGEVESLLIARNSERVITGVRSLVEHRARAYSGDNAMTIILWTVIVLLVAITALGIVGIVSFNVNQRIKQIGTRRALGATKIDILRYFITENILITSLGLVVGTLLTIGFNVYLVEQYNMPAFNWYLIPIGILIMLTVGFISVLMPALKASKVSPAVATQSI